MSKRKITLRKISTEYLLDPEETLLKAWLNGLDHLASLDTPLSSRDLKKASDLFGLPSTHELTRKVYWQEVLRLSEGDLRALLEKEGLSWNEKSSKVPKGAVVILQKHRKTLLPTIRENVSASLTKEKVVAQTPPPKLEWKEIGHLPLNGEIRYLTVDEVSEIHFSLAEDFALQRDPIYPAGVKSRELLESAIYRPMTANGDELKYPTIEMASAALIHSIINNHPFHNGNKRTGLVSMLAMLDENGLLLECDESDLFLNVVKIAKHAITDSHPYERNDREVLAIAEWLSCDCRLIRKGDRPIQARKLPSMLSNFGCTVSDRRAGKIKISRQVEGSGYLRRKRTVTHILHSWEDGAEITAIDMGKLRKDLLLDEENGVDSRSFYDTGAITVDGFIRTYRKTLQKLSRM